MGLHTAIRKRPPASSATGPTTTTSCRDDRSGPARHQSGPGHLQGRHRPRPRPYPAVRRTACGARQAGLGPLHPGAKALTRRSPNWSRRASRRSICCVERSWSGAAGGGYRSGRLGGRKSWDDLQGNSTAPVSGLSKLAWLDKGTTRLRHALVSRRRTSRRACSSRNCRAADRDLRRMARARPGRPDPGIPGDLAWSAPCCSSASQSARSPKASITGPISLIRADHVPVWDRHHLCRKEFSKG